MISDNISQKSGLQESQGSSLSKMDRKISNVKKPELVLKIKNAFSTTSKIRIKDTQLRRYKDYKKCKSPSSI